MQDNADTARYVIKTQKGSGPLEGKTLYYVQDRFLGYCTDNTTNRAAAKEWAADLNRKDREAEAM